MQVLPIVEKDTFTSLIESKLRFDGRDFTEFRDVKFKFASDACKYGGSCIATIGGTSILAHVSIDVVEPRSSRPAQGILLVNFDLKKLVTLFGKKHHRKFDNEGRRLSNMFQNCLRDSIDLNNLCILAWESVFCIRVELSVISYDGNLADCGILAAMAALATFKRPDVYVNAEGKVTVDFDEHVSPRIPLQLMRVPVLVTLALTHNNSILVDPTYREESHLTIGKVIIGMTEFHEICTLYTTDVKSAISNSTMEECIKLASAKAKGLTTLLKRVLDGYTKYRESIYTKQKGRQSEIARVESSLAACPVILSSADFVGPVPESHLEQGEIDLEPEEDLLSDEDYEKNGEANDKKAIDLAKQVLNVAQHEPYGFVEIDTLKDIKEKALQDEANKKSRKRKKIIDIEDDEEQVMIL